MATAQLTRPFAGLRTVAEIIRAQEAEALRRERKARWTYAAKRAARLAVTA
jgi:hypothetical protein